MQLFLKLATEELAPEARRLAGELARRCPAITSCRIGVQKLEAGGVEAHVELLAGQHQIIVNREHEDARAAVRGALGLAGERLAQAAARDPALGYAGGMSAARNACASASGVR